MPGIWFLASDYAPSSKDGNESEPSFGLLSVYTTIGHFRTYSAMQNGELNRLLC